jgi:predicted SAM-dependent methyltransferase
LSKHHKVYRSIKEIPVQLDFIFLIDVLEHLENDEEFLRSFFNKLNPGGKLFLYVPAGKKLFSDFDKGLGHFRRYSKNELRDKVVKAGFKVDYILYHESLSYFASLIHNVFLKKKIPSARSMKLYDRYLVPLSNAIENVIKPSFGKSLYLSATKK